MEEAISERADALAARLMKAESFDAVTDLAHDLPINVVMDLIGWPEQVRPHHLDMADGSFDAVGPDGELMRSSPSRLEAIMELITDVYDSGTLVTGGFGSTIADPARRCEIPRGTAIGMLAGYVVEAFDTTTNHTADPRSSPLYRNRPRSMPTYLWGPAWWHVDGGPLHYC